MKDVMLTIRLPQDLRDRYQAALKAQDETAAQHLRGVIATFCEGTEAEFGAVLFQTGVKECYTGTGKEFLKRSVRINKADRKGGRHMLTVDRCFTASGEGWQSFSIPLVGDANPFVDWLRSVDQIADEERAYKILSEIEPRMDERTGDQIPLRLEDLPQNT